MGLIYKFLQKIPILGPTRSRSPDSGVTLISGSETSSFIEISNLWPLFVQFSAAVHLPNGQMDTFPLEYIPSCVKDFIDRCSPGIVPSNIEACKKKLCQNQSYDILAIHDVIVRIDMYVLTWPLPMDEPHFEPYDSHPSSQHNSGNDAERRVVGSITLHSIDEEDDRSIDEEDDLIKDTFEALNELPEKVKSWKR